MLVRRIQAMLSDRLSQLPAVGLLGARHTGNYDDRENAPKSVIAGEIKDDGKVSRMAWRG